jgi:uncharacterized Tic20 family protein
MQPLLTEAAQFKLAFPLERKHQFVDVQGKKKYSLNLKIKVFLIDRSVVVLVITQLSTSVL